jgi:hypothetical protein
MTDQSQRSSARALTLILVILVMAIAAIGIGQALAAKDCVSYSVTAPFVGTRQGTACPIPNPFTQPFRLFHCENVPPAGVSACVTIDTHVPAF